MTYLTTPRIIFEHRHDAGIHLAAELSEYNDQSVVVLAIPNGGVPVALEIASALKADLDVIVCRKIPIPLAPEGGFGAVTDDGTTILNDEIVKKFNLSPQQISYQASMVRTDIRQRSLLYRKDLSPCSLTNKRVLIVDDGLASGYTMMAAVESVRQRRPREIIAAVPVASAAALKKVEKIADKVIACVAGFGPEFYVSDFYRYWHEPGDDEVIQCIKEWQLRHLKSIIKPLEKK